MSLSANEILVPNIFTSSSSLTKVERVEVKDVRLPKNLQRAMAAEAEATREAQAKVRPNL